jgi:RNA polymerase sigma-70 factor (ECF subfamily)
MSGFRTTVWTTINAAAAGRDTAVRELVARYRPAVVAFARKRGLDAATAEDVAQETLLQIFEGGVLAKADPERGRFRSLVAAVARNVVGSHFERTHAKKRGGGARPVPLDADALAREPSDPEFDRAWAAGIVAAALDRLERENPDYFSAIRSFLLEEKSRSEAAAELGKTEDSVRNLVSRGKAKLARILRDEIEGYAASNEELEEELRWIARYLEKPAS